MKTAFRSCPICGYDQVDILHKQNFILPDAHPLKDGYEVVCCGKCGFVYADTIISQEVYDRYYAQNSKYEDSKIGTGGVETPWDLERLKKTASQISSYLNEKSASILDVGCANGGLLKSLQALGHKNIFGIDPSPTCVENTRKLGIDAETGTLLQPIAHRRFDCVVLSHTLEHIQDLKGAFRWIKNVSKNNGSVYIEVPNAARYLDFVDAPFQDFNTEHINHFSLIALNNFLNVNDYSPFKSGEKIIPASANALYPAIFCFATKSDTTREVIKDKELHSRIKQYIAISQNILNSIEAKLHLALHNSGQIIVWGTGQLTMKLLADTSLSQAEIIAFVDSNPINQGKILHGVQIVAPKDIVGRKVPILISSTLHQQSIIDQIHKMGLPNPLILLKE